ncbi:MAG: membrane protein insertion efficiency factor YidD [Candidatus Peribacteria bacterium]|jgi:putative component of membrane protein insertase Oxa1/YidC/SpoIIIJ protein YidD|nr:membrane protein insertion efficiency factor YidD [Candidatus Peribacteria bacterium]
MTVLDSLLANLTIFFIKLYQLTLSPDKGIFSPILKGRICSHEPHCSEYAVRTLKRYGFRKGIGKVIERVLHCKPRMMKIYDPEHYRVVFFSSAPLGVPFLEALAKDKRFEVIGVVTQADKPVGRGLQMQENVIKTKGKEIFTTTLVRYFFLKESLQN